MSVKRLASLTTLLTLILLALPGISPASAVKLTAWHPFPNVPAHEGWKNLIDQFNRENPGIEIEYAYGPTASPDQFLPMVAAGVAPDLIFMNHAVAPGYAAQGFLLDLTPFAERDGVLGEYLSDFFPGAITGTIWRERLYALTHSISSCGLPYYNEFVFAESGLAPPVLGWDWNEYSELSLKVRRVGAGGEIERHGTITYNALHFAFPVVIQSGARMVDPEMRRSLVAEGPELRAALEFLADLVDRDLLLFVSGGLAAATEINRQNGAGFFHDCYRVFDFRETAPGLRIAPALRSPGREPATWTGWFAWGALAGNDAEKNQAAWEFIKWSMSVDVQVYLVEAANAIPARHGAAQHPRFRALLEGDEDYRMAIEQNYPYVTTEGFYGHPLTSVVNGIITPLLNETLRKDRRPILELIDTAHRTFQGNIDEFWQ